MVQLEDEPGDEQLASASAPPAATVDDDDGLWFVCCVSNPVGYRSRVSLYEKFVRHVRGDLRAKLCVVECVYGPDAEHSLDPERVPVGAGEGVEGPRLPRTLYVRARAGSVLWHKENLLNVGIRAVREADPGRGSRYVVWADADVEFLDGRRAVAEIVRALDAHPVVQAFGTCLDLGPDGEVLKVDQSFMMSHEHGFPRRNAPGQTFWHSGYVWAARGDFLDAIGGLFDLAILGAGDRMMANAFVRDMAEFEAKRGSRGDVAAALGWAEGIARALDAYGGCETRRAGYARCVIRHGFHGFKKDRGYNTRGEVLKRHAFDPSTDLTRNAEGLLEWADGVHLAAMADEVLAYFSSRNEDATGRSEKKKN